MALSSTSGIDLAAEDVSFAYPDGTRALSSVSLAVPAGSRTAIIGQNGSGKSTLVRHFNGLLRATSGRVVVDGTPVGRRHVADLARLVGISFQNPDRQIFAGRVRAEVAFGPRNLGLRGAALEDLVDRALQTVGLTEHANANPYDLGFSERKLLALASVLAMGTPAIVLDEPTTGQDANGVQRVKQLVDQLAREGRTVLAISHDMRFVAEAFDRVVVMREGRIVNDGSPAEVFAEECWPILRSANLEPTYAAVVGAQLGFGATPTDRTFIKALSGRRDKDQD